MPLWPNGHRGGAAPLVEVLARGWWLGVATVYKTPLPHCAIKTPAIERLTRVTDSWHKSKKLFAASGDLLTTRFGLRVGPSRASEAAREGAVPRGGHVAVVVPAARLAFYEDHEKPQPIFETYEWPELIELLTEHEFTECTPCPGGQQCKAKFTLAFSPGAPREGTTRANKNVESVSLLVYDFDHLTRAELEGVCDRISGLESVLYSTHSHHHKGPDDCCVRIFFPLSRPLSPHEFRHVRTQVIARYGLEWIRPGAPPRVVGADPNPKDISRLYFLPTAPVGTAVEAGHQEGALLDLDEILQGVPRASAPRPRLVVAPSISSPEGMGPPLELPPVDMDLLRRLLKEYKPKNEERDLGELISRKELVRRVYEQEPLVRPEEEGKRNISCHRIAKILAYLLPSSTPEEAMIELVRKSVRSMPAYDTDGEKDTVDARFATISRSWNEGIKERADQEAVFEAQREAERSASRRFREWSKRKEAKRSSPPPASEAPRESGEGGDPDAAGTPVPTMEDELDGPSSADWEDMLVYKETKNGRVLLGFLANILTLLSFHPEWFKMLAYNEITKNVEIRGGPLEVYEKTPQQIVVGTKAWLQTIFEVDFRTADVLDALVHVAKSNAYNPLQEYLSVTRHDGVPRVDTFLETYCGASLMGVDKKDITSYVRKVSRRWLVSAVARALTPGCKMDTVLILEGKTGIYKSTALKALGGPFFSDSKIAIGEKDAMQLAGTNWIHEIAELTAFHASETEQQKAFFSSPVDQFRAPYDKVPDKYPRLACFVGSTNDERYMNDPTGNRRYWPIECIRSFSIRDLRRDRDQLWAEAVAIFRAGLTCLKCQALNIGLPSPWHEQYAHDRCEQHRWWFDNSENDELEKVNVHRLRAEYADTIREYLLRLSPENRRAAYTLNEIAIDMLKLAPDRVLSQTAGIGRALKVLGFEKDRPTENGIQLRVFVTPELLLRAPKKPPAHMKLVTGGEK